MSENESPELNFLKEGKLFELIKKDKLRSVAIAKSILLGQKRDFSKDSERLARNLESANILGAENIPAEHIPIIVACNHPDIYDLVVGTINTTQAFNEKRRANNVPGEIHWMVAQNIPPRDVMKSISYRTMYGLIDYGLRKLNHTYNFIPVPINVNLHTPQAHTSERAKVFLSARQYLRDKEGSRVVGMFPEGDIEKVDAISEFYDGIGLLARSIGTDTVTVLPVGIYRNDMKQLNIEFGKPLPTNRSENQRSITEKVRSAISDVSKKPIEKYPAT